MNTDWNAVRLLVKLAMFMGTLSLIALGSIYVILAMNFEWVQDNTTWIAPLAALLYVVFLNFIADKIVERMRDKHEQGK